MKYISFFVLFLLVVVMGYGQNDIRVRAYNDWLSSYNLGQVITVDSIVQIDSDVALVMKINYPNAEAISAFTKLTEKFITGTKIKLVDLLFMKAAEICRPSKHYYLQLLIYNTTPSECEPSIQIFWREGKNKIEVLYNYTAASANVRLSYDPVLTNGGVSPNEMVKKVEAFFYEKINSEVMVSRINAAKSDSLLIKVCNIKGYITANHEYWIDFLPDGLSNLLRAHETFVISMPLSTDGNISNEFILRLKAQGAPFTSSPCFERGNDLEDEKHSFFVHKLLNELINNIQNENK